jgi:hypothetical protein
MPNKKKRNLKHNRLIYLIYFFDPVKSQKSHGSRAGGPPQAARTA